MRSALWEPSASLITTAALLAAALACPSVCRGDEGTTNAARRYTPYLVIPLRGTFGKEITPDYVKHGLDFAAENGVREIVFRIDSDGGAVNAAIGIMNLLQERADQHHYSIIIDKAISASIWVVFSCQEIFMTEDAVLGGAVAYTLDGQGGVEISEKMNSAIAAELGNVASRNGHSLALVRAMVSKGASAYASRNDHGTWVFSNDARPIGSEAVTLDTANTVLTLASTEAIRFSIAKAYDSERHTISNRIGDGTWVRCSVEAEMWDIYRRAWRAVEEDICVEVAHGVREIWIPGRWK